MTKRLKTKTVFVIGAGFSVEAKAPSQDKLVKKIFEVHKVNSSVFKENKIKEFTDFLSETLCIPSEFHETIPLEDIFTPLDSCLANNVSFKNLSVDEISNKRKLVFELIGLTLQHLLKSSNKKYIDDFAKYLVDISKDRKQNYRLVDPVTVISTNWDILLDNSLYNKIRSERDLAVVDYCCYVSSYDESDDTVKPGLEILGKGGYNVKLLKLHGSLNWLQCQKCQRIYVKFNQKIAMNPYADVDRPTCRHCDWNFGKLKSHHLVSNLIMPTFLKDLSNPQYKIIWQNAGIELSEAKKIVFIGYSLPQADFEMRQLLSRMVDIETEIEVVDFKDRRNPNIYDDLIRSYKQFFGREVKDHKEGASKYISQLVNG
jgi:NAD-dependent SIR2 family protein deacetylase